MTTADVAAAHALWTDPDVRRYLWDGVVITIDQAREVIATSEADFRARRYGLWGSYERASDRLVGFSGCRRWPTGEPELMYGLSPAWWKRGLAVEMGAAVLGHVFETLGHPVVVAATDPPNVASVRVMERLGMTFDARRVVHGLDTVVYRLSRERWRAGCPGRSNERV
jgi:[ribosomal protein S5]-alanine N-acetyltransferase